MPKPPRPPADTDKGAGQKVPLPYSLIKEVDAWRGKRMAKTGRNMHRSDAAALLIRAGLKALRQEGGGQDDG